MPVALPPAVFLSTLPVRGATVVVVFKLVHFVISIHAPREGSDLALVVEAAVGGGISIHAPREGSDPPSSSSPS